MKYEFRIIPENQEERDKLLGFLDTHNASITTRESDSNINDKDTKNQQEPVRKYHCNNPQCKKEITKDVVAFCLHEDNRSRFQGKVFCRECQKEEN